MDGKLLNVDITTEEGKNGLKSAIADADAVVICAGEKVSACMQLTGCESTFTRFFGDFEKKYDLTDVRKSESCNFESIAEAWGYESRLVYLTRYQKTEIPVLSELVELTEKKEYFVITTNTDSQMKKAGFEPEKILAINGDMGKWQCVHPCIRRTYDNKSQVVKMLLAQGFGIDEKGKLTPPSDDEGNTDFSQISMEVPEELIPACPICGQAMRPNVRDDETFVADDELKNAALRCSTFLKEHAKKKILVLDAGCKTDEIETLEAFLMQQRIEVPQKTLMIMKI